MPIARGSRYNPGMRITLLYFAAARERAGLSRETLELVPGATARTALETACAKSSGPRRHRPPAANRG